MTTLDRRTPLALGAQGIGPEHMWRMLAPSADAPVLTMLDHPAERGARVKWVTSVCTGGLVLGAAGLLRSFDATTYWAVTDLLPL